MSVLKVENLKKTYVTRFGSERVNALKNVNFTVDKGDYVAIMGESGSGKTTLLNILAALDKPTSGQVILDGRNLSEIKENELASFRRENLGFVFQEFNLLDTLSVKDNILLPLVLSGKNVRDYTEKLASLCSSIGINEILEKYPYEISGGQKQRAAVARALITSPKIVLADEPTGALDSSSSGDLLRVFEQVNRQGNTILIVTHSTDAASHANRILFIRDGVIFHQIYRGDCTNDELYKKISDTLTMLRSGGKNI
ncbi:MAG: ABC transporter ATP-binding protein [Firmicutes bacterium]|nr:ABC transporter ATP-binding protein [Candidatus Colimorpha enterica]